MFVDPVKEITLTSGCWTKASPAFDPRPQQRFTTPSGRPASWKICRKKFIFSYSALFFSRQLFFFVKWKKLENQVFFYLVKLFDFARKLISQTCLHYLGHFQQKMKTTRTCKTSFCFLTGFSSQKNSYAISEDPPNTLTLIILTLQSIQVVTVVISLGLHTTVQPAIRAGAILNVNRYNGRFHGEMSPATPTGLRIE